MYNIDIKEAIAYKHHNMELKDNDVIGQFRQNILGESVPINNGMERCEDNNGKNY